MSRAALDATTRALPGLRGYRTPVWVALVAACAYTAWISWRVVARLRERPSSGPLL